jgi:hypothetical protein
MDNRQACRFRNHWRRHNSEMQPQGRRIDSPLRTRRQRPYGQRKTTLRTVGLNAEKKIGTEPKGSCFLLTFPLIGLPRLIGELMQGADSRTSNLQLERALVYNSLGWMRCLCSRRPGARRRCKGVGQCTQKPAISWLEAGSRKPTSHFSCSSSS